MLLLTSVDDETLTWIAKATGAKHARKGERIQSLWSGYGEIFRVRLSDAPIETVVVKWVKPPAALASDVSHTRKCRSYDVETTWYRTLAKRTHAACRVPACIDSRVANSQWLLVLEDLDAAGFPDRRRNLRSAEMNRCLAWLASFHATFLGVEPTNLWKLGTYWHLATRREELAEIDDEALREAAPILDQKLRAATFQTIVHGDAKPANFCFGGAREGVAAVDFQYVGGGCGMKDVAYLLACRSSSEADDQRDVDTYFVHLRSALSSSSSSSSSVDVAKLEAEWRALYPIACADFYRFLAGWAKHEWRRDAYAQRLTRNVLRTL